MGQVIGKAARVLRQDHRPNHEQRTVTTRGGARSRGSATVEFALVLPLVLTMALAIVQLGILVKDQLVVVESARAGAREASVDDDEAAQQAASDAASSLDTARLDVSIQREGGAGSPVAVSVIYHAPVVVPL